MNNRLFVFGSFLLNVYTTISLICLSLLIFIKDSGIYYIPVHFCVTLLILTLYVFWRKTYYREELHESESLVSVYKWTTRGLVLTFILYAIVYLLFIGLLLLFSGPPLDY